MAGTLQGNIPFSASTAAIRFNGTEVGQLQNMRWSERNNLRRINSIGSSVPVAILKGVSEYNISASKAFIDADLMVTLLRGLSMQELNAATGGSDLTITTKGRVTATGIADATTVLQSALANNQAFAAYSKIVNFFFEIVVSSYSTDNTTGIGAVSTFSDQNMIKFTECSIESRDSRIDVGNLVVMNDVSILCLGLQYGTNPIITGALS